MRTQVLHFLLLLNSHYSSNLFIELRCFFQPKICSLIFSKLVVGCDLNLGTPYWNINFTFNKFFKMKEHKYNTQSTHKQEVPTLR